MDKLGSFLRKLVLLAMVLLVGKSGMDMNGLMFAGAAWGILNRVDSLGLILVTKALTLLWNAA